jgi:hypothetical protein
MTTFPQIASACFTIDGEGQDVTIEGVSFDWNPEAGDRDMQAATAVAKWFGENVSAAVGLTLLWVTCSPA